MKLKSCAAGRVIEHAYVAFGSNVGSILPRDVIVEMERRGIAVPRRAKSYESRPAEGVTGGTFINTVFECERRDSPEEFLRTLQGIELLFGSRVDKHMTERTCDLDLLLWGDNIIDMPNLKVPHPRMRFRDFVLAPLCDLIPDEPLPIFGKPPCDLLSELTVRYIIRQIPE